MKCPLSRYRLASPYPPVKEEREDCLEEECPWWDEESKRCCVFVGMMSLEWIKLRLEMIEAKMPHEEQFRKKGGKYGNARKSTEWKSD